MAAHRTIFVCNALEDDTRIERNISTDSPASSRKIFLMAKALKHAGDYVTILSMGRGHANGSRRYFSSKVKKNQGVPIIYAPFSERRFISEVISLLSLPCMLFRMRGLSATTSVIFWNRTSAYMPALLTSYLLGFSRVLDLEDGDLPVTRWSLKELYITSKRLFYNIFCSYGAIIACKELASTLGSKPHFCYYGVTENVFEPKLFDSSSKIIFLMCGTVSYDTGALTLFHAIKLLKDLDEPWANRLEFVITGKGDCIQPFVELMNSNRAPSVRVTGRLNDNEYNDILSSAHVGLALKQVTGPLATTTFPSKVIEMASAGLLVLTTDISDVRSVFGNDGAIYLSDDNPKSLFNKVRWIVDNPMLASSINKKGTEVMKAKFSLFPCGEALRTFLIDSNGN